MQRFEILGRLMGLNEYTSANRANQYMGASKKREQEKLITSAILAAELKPVDKYPVNITITWYEPNQLRDYDNIVFAKKFVLDALVKCGILKDDRRRYVKSVIDKVKVDKDKPHIVVEIWSPVEDTVCPYCRHDSRILQAWGEE